MRNLENKNEGRMTVCSSRFKERGGRDFMNEVRGV